MKPEKDQTFECLLFSHKEVIAVKGLGGVCYTFSDKPPQQEDDDEAGIDDHDAEEEEDAPVQYSKYLPIQIQHWNDFLRFDASEGMKMLIFCNRPLFSF